MYLVSNPNPNNNKIIGTSHASALCKFIQKTSLYKYV